MPSSARSYCPRGWRQTTYILLILVLASCAGRNGISPPVSQQTECLFGTTGSCFYWRETSSEPNEKLVIFVHGVFSTSANTWGDVNTGNTWPELVRGDDNFKHYDIYLVNYRTTYVTSAPNIYHAAKRELERLKDKGIFKQYKEIYFIAHSMGGLVTKNLLKQLNRREDEPLLRQVRGVVYLGTPSQGVGVSRLGKWLSFNPQLGAMEPASLNQWISELEDDWIRLMDERGESQFPRAFCAYEMRPYRLGYIVVPREAAYSRCDTFTGLDLDHSDLAVPGMREKDPYDWAMGAILRTSKVSNTIDDIKVLFECDYKDFIKMVPAEGGPHAVLFFHAEKYFTSSPSGRHFSVIQGLGMPGRPNVFSDPERNGGRGWVCQITSYEKYPVLNLELDFDLQFKEPIYEPKQAVKGGAIKSEVPWTSVIEKLEPNEKFVFYLLNYSEYFLEAETPDWIYFHRLGEFETKRTARLPSVRGRGRLHFGPSIYPVPPKRSPSDVPS